MKIKTVLVLFMMSIGAIAQANVDESVVSFECVDVKYGVRYTMNHPTQEALDNSNNLFDLLFVGVQSVDQNGQVKLEKYKTLEWSIPVTTAAATNRDLSLSFSALLIDGKWIAEIKLPTNPTKVINSFNSELECGPR